MPTHITNTHTCCWPYRPNACGTEGDDFCSLCIHPLAVHSDLNGCAACQLIALGELASRQRSDTGDDFGWMAAGSA
jgi:phage-related protein